MAASGTATKRDTPATVIRRRRWPQRLLGLALAALVVLVTIDLMLAGDAVVVAVGEHSSTPPAATLSSAQQSVVAELGYPDGFTIYFFTGDTGDAAARVETWSYYAAGREISFVDGERATDGTPEEPAADVVAAPFTPDQFTPFMTLDEVVAAAGITEYLEVQLEDELIQDGTVHVAEQLMFGLKDGRLLYVEAVALAGEE